MLSSLNLGPSQKSDENIHASDNHQVSFLFFLLFLLSLPWVRKALSLFNDMMCMFRSTQLRMMQSLYLRAFISVHSNDARVGWLQLTECKNETLQV